MAANYTIQVSGTSNTQVQAPLTSSTLTLGGGSANWVTLVAGGMTLGATSTLGGGSGGILSLPNVTTAPTSSVSGAALLYSSGGQLNIYPSGVTASVASFGATTATFASGYNFGFGSNQFGSGTNVIALAGGTPPSASTTGGVVLLYANLGAFCVTATGNTSPSLTVGATVVSTSQTVAVNQGSSTFGGMVGGLAIGKVTTAPSTAASGAALLYTDSSGSLNFYPANANVTSPVAFVQGGSTASSFNTAVGCNMNVASTWAKRTVLLVRGPRSRSSRTSSGDGS